MSEEHGSMFDSLLGKAEGALDKFMSDPEKVDKAKGKAEDFLGKYVDHSTADQITDTAENALRQFTERDSQHGE